MMFRQIKRRGNPQPPAIATDGWGGYRLALLKVWGKFCQGPKRSYYRSTTAMRYLQLHKQRNAQWRVIGVEARVRYGPVAETVALLGSNTAYVERSHLTMRQMNGRLVRKTLSYSKAARYLEASCVYNDWVYNLCRPVRTLRAAVNEQDCRWQQRSAAMAAGLTDHIWTIAELLTTVVLPERDLPTLLGETTPELNPAERVFEEVRRSIEGQPYDSIAQKQAAIETYLTALATDPERVRRLAGWDWIVAACASLPHITSSA